MINNLASQQIPLNASSSDQTVLPYALQTVTLTRQDYIELKWQGQRWKAQFLRASVQLKSLKEELKQKTTMLRETLSEKIREAKCAREEALLLTIQEKEALICDLTHRLYGNKKERTGKVQAPPQSLDEEALKRPRGQQKGSAGHGRTDRSGVPVIEETLVLEETCCPQCKQPYSRMPNETSTVMEVAVQAYTRRIHRERRARNCTCIPGPKTLTAILPPKLLPKSLFGNSIWEEVLLNKFLYAQPLNRTLEDFKTLGLCISPGSIAGGLKQLAPLFVPLYKALHEQQKAENRFHTDETRWKVYEHTAGKAGYRWYLWIMRSASVVYYRLAKTRSAETPLSHFADFPSPQIIIVCDRYVGYKRLARLNPAILLAFCWVHVRRDFLVLVRSYPDLKEWGLDWVEAIGRLFHLNHERCMVWNPTLPLTHQSALFQERQQTLRGALTAMQKRCSQLLETDRITKENKAKAPERLTTAQREVLVSLQTHWEGLTVFYDYPEVPMDNNAAEQAIRHPVCGRKTYYGSGSLWSADLTTMLFSLFQTVSLCWQLNPRTWLRAYLEACALNGGKPPNDLNAFLPWQMSETNRQKWSQPPLENSS